ncbi:flagellar export protein FliJ [Paenibacillus eucommiae]|uniref:Flagellar FliJ protein n=1 Tax=Paenibacillus eucommiae TaxID=1355755 RepID=A0ABS4IUT6_9BACL|nr:flagellar export protein FliJ [Paenibacillus eucommiae]MBP1991337.1 flagellar FliJ protein [Paenibacillus eucommiae]
MKFQYSFQQIVNLKNNEKTQAEWILSEAIVRLHSEENGLTELDRQKTELSEQISKASADSIIISEMLLLQNYMNHLDQEIIKKNREVQIAQRLVVKEQAHLSEKMIDEKVWMKAREKAYVQFQALSGKKEQEALDEMTTNRFKRLSEASSS